jgi:hypothetical protein
MDQNLVLPRIVPCDRSGVEISLALGGTGLARDAATGVAALSCL